MIDYSDKRALIIEDLAEMRSSMRSMLNRLGVAECATACNGEDGIELFGQQPFDIVMCDYELGKGKDGQQVLEELRHSGLLKPSVIFVLVTAAQTVDMVLGALENEPDGYIAKPVTFDELKLRLERISNIKNVYKTVNKYIELDRIDDAIEECNKIIGERPKLALNCYRIKSRLLYEMERYEEARDIYTMVVGIRHLVWAQLGLAKTNYHLGDYDAAIETLDELIKENENCIEAMDWRATLAEAQGNPASAQKSLEFAVEKSPKSIQRQIALGEAASHNEDWPVAAQAYRKAISLAKNSVFKSPEVYMAMIRAHQPRLKVENGRNFRFALSETQRALKELKKDYQKDKRIQIYAHALDGLTHYNTSKQKDCVESMGKARIIYQGYQPEYGDEEWALAYELMDLMRDCEDPENLKLLQQFISGITGEVFEEEEEQAEQAKADELNNRAAELYEEGRIAESVELFTQAMRLDGASTSVMLNALQALVTYMQKRGSIDEMKQDCRNCLEKLEGFPKDDPRYDRYKRLEKMFKKLK